MNPQHTCRIGKLVCMGLTLAASCAVASEDYPQRTRRAPDTSQSSERIAAVDAVVVPPRAFGYFIGDLVQQRVLLEAQGRTFTPGELPNAVRTGVWFERRPATVVSSQDGKRWLVLEYQIVNAPHSLATISLPRVRLTDAAGTMTLNVPASTISVSALTPPLDASSDFLQALRADRAAPKLTTEPIRRQLFAWSAALIATLALWAGWLAWRNWRASASQPFARALRELSDLDEGSPEAWQALHRAFDRTAGRVTQTATLPSLFEKAPHFESARAGIELFYRQSNEFFFARGLPGDALSVHRLCRELRKIEKRHE